MYARNRLMYMDILVNYVSKQMSYVQIGEEAPLFYYDKEFFGIQEHTQEEKSVADLSKRLADARKERGMTQREVAEQ